MINNSFFYILGICIFLLFSCKKSNSDLKRNLIITNDKVDSLEILSVDSVELWYKNKKFKGTDLPNNLLIESSWLHTHKHNKKNIIKKVLFDSTNLVVLDFRHLKLSHQTRIETFSTLYPISTGRAKGAGHVWSGLVIIENSKKEFDYSKWFLFFRNGSLK